MLFIHADGVGAGAPDALEADFNVVLARGAVDALKRLTADAATTSCVVAPASLPDLPLDAFVKRVREADPNVSIVVYGDLPGDPSEVTALVDVDAYVPGGRDTTLADRIRRLQTDTWIDRGLAQHRRLAAVIAAIAVDAAAAEDRETIESAVYDRLMGADHYRLAWIGRMDAGEGLTVSVPVPTSVDDGALGDLVGGGDQGFIDRAVETGRVVTTERAVSTRATARTTPASTDGPTALQSAAVPFLHRGRVLGVAIISTEAPGAFDGSERELLADLGAIVGHALWSLDPPDRPAGDRSPSEEMETLVHELRNPLGIAKSHLDIAREDEDFEPLERAGSALDRMADIIDRIGTGRVGEPTLDLTIGSLEEDARLAWGSIESGSVDLELQASAPFEADHDLVVRLLSNLFQNAVEHGGGAVSVRIGTLADGFYVEDDGRGIDPADRDAIFQRGYSTAADGQGIGLPLVQDVVTAHGWEISVDESRSGGARFEVTGIEWADDAAGV